VDVEMAEHANPFYNEERFIGSVLITEYLKK
jgi:hypothetical protein